MERLFVMLAQWRLELDLGLDVVSNTLRRRYPAHRVHLDLGDGSLTWRADDFHDLHQLVRIVAPSEEGVPSDHLS